MLRSTKAQLAALFPVAGLVLLLVGVAVAADTPSATDQAKCTLESSRFWADAGPAAPAAPGGVGRVWDQNNILWTIASDYAGMSAADRAQNVAEMRLVPWTMKEKTCGKHQVHLGMYQGNYVIYRATAAPSLPTADNIIVTVDPATARYHHDRPAHLAYYWWYRLSSFLQGEVPAEKLPRALEKEAAPMASSSYTPSFSPGSVACGHIEGCGCGLTTNPNAAAGCATCGGPVPAPPGPPTY